MIFDQLYLLVIRCILKTYNMQIDIGYQTAKKSVLSHNWLHLLPKALENFTVKFILSRLICKFDIMEYCSYLLCKYISIVTINLYNHLIFLSSFNFNLQLSNKFYKLT